jgi:hypothetical protein
MNNSQAEVAIGWVEFGFGQVGSGKFDQKNLSGHGSGPGRFGLGQVSGRTLSVFFGSRVIRAGLGFGFL